MEGDDSSISALPPKFVHLYSVMSEYNLVMKFHPPGVYVIPSIEDQNLWHGIISVRKGCYAGGAFPFRVVIPDNFPSYEAPKLSLPVGFYHPNVNPQTGELDLGSELNKWTPSTSHIFHILDHLRCSLNEVSNEGLNPSDIKNFVNSDAAQTLISDIDKFESKAKSYVEEHSLWSTTDFSSKTEFSSPLSVFGWQNDNLISTIREKIANSSKPFKNCPCCTDAGSRGYSWIDPVKMTLFSPNLLCSKKQD